MSLLLKSLVIIYLGLLTRQITVVAAIVASMLALSGVTVSPLSADEFTPPLRRCGATLPGVLEPGRGCRP